MDTPTHALIGTAISDCWFRKRLGPAATPFALIVGALPDLDAVTYLIAPEYAWAHHRGYSHSFFTFIFAAPILGLIGYFLARKSGTWLQWAFLALICLVSHTLGDLITSWGTMPLLPFSNARISWDVAPILDIFLTSVTAASFLANRILRWEKVDTFLNPLVYPVVHRHPGRQRAANRVAAVCVFLVVTYLLVGWRQNAQTVELARRELAAAGIEAVEVRALPLMFTYVSWGIAARDAEGTVYNAVHSSYAPKPMRFEAFPTVHGPAVDSALSTPDGAMFAWYAQRMYVAEEEPLDDGCRVRLRDRRFFTLSRSYQSRFVMEFREDGNNDVMEVSSLQMGLEGVSIRDELELLWRLTSTGETGQGAAESVASR